MELDALLLARIQFAFTIGYHILFPTLSTGLAMLLVVLGARELLTGDPRYRQAAIFWTRFFALSFGMGVVSGVVLSYEIGTNWGRFAEITGAVVGPLMSYEVVSAFFLEAGFLGIVLFGRARVGPRLHFFATCMVALGTLFSAFWILSANSFMHTPAGYELRDGLVHVTSWVEAIFNPSFPWRLAHMIAGMLLASAVLVAACGAWMMRRTPHAAFGLHNLKLGIGLAALLAPLQVLIGDQHGLNTLEHQPIKIAAMEGHWHTGVAPLVLFALPDQQAERNRFELAVPNVASLILTHDPDGEVLGLTSVPAADRPPVAIVFWSFRVMVGCGLLMLSLAWYGAWLWRRGRLERSGTYLRIVEASGPLGFIAILAGWVTTECGRQPWTVQGILRTADSTSLVDGSNVALTLVLFFAVYGLLFCVFVAFFLRLLRAGPEPSPTPFAEHA